VKSVKSELNVCQWYGDDNSGYLEIK